MKHILLISILFLLIFSCEEKEEQFCWDCYITDYDYYIKMDQEPVEKSHTDSLLICDHSEYEILLYEKDHTIYPYSITTGGTHLIWTTCRCIKKE